MSFPPPSFSSFPDFASDNPKDSEEGVFKDRSRKKKDKDKDKRGTKTRHHRSRSIEGLAHRPEGRGHQRHHETTQKRPISAETPLFYSDTSGDRLNIEYGGLHEGDVPRYHVLTRGKEILGLNSAWVASHRTRNSVEIGIKARRKMSELTDPRAKDLLSVPPTRRLLQSATNKVPEESVRDFLRLSTHSHGPSYQNTPTGNTDTAWNKSDSEDECDSFNDLTDDSSEDESGSVQLTSYQVKLRDLNQEVTKTPGSARAWLELLRHMLSTVPKSSKNAAVARAEITLSVMARALVAHPSNKISRLLRLTYMKAGELVWDHTKMEAEWHEIVKDSDPEMWLEWLEWRIHQSGRNVEDVAEDVVRLLSRLDQSQESELLKVRVLWRIAICFKNAGFAERSTALFQAQAELTFGLPWSLYNVSHEARLIQLEAFWESEVPRVGEEGAEGWSAWVEGLSKDCKQPNCVSSEGNLNDLDPYRLWWKRESYADRTHSIPSRSYCDTNDPYETILFSDIRGLLISLESDSARSALRFAWLAVLGLPIPGMNTLVAPSSEANWDDRWCLDALISPHFLNRIFPPPSSETGLSAISIAGTVIGRERMYTSGFGPIRNWGFGVLTPLEDPCLDAISQTKQTRTGLWKWEDVRDVDQDFIRRLFSQLRLGDADEEWDDYALSFEAAIGLKGAVKHSRALLKRAESLPRWISHTQLEILRGQPDDARKVFQAVSQNIQAPNSARGVGRFWWTWAEMEWLSKNTSRSLEIILTACQVQGEGRIAVLKAKRQLDDDIQIATNWKEREYWIKLRVLLEILSGNDTSLAMSVMDKYLGQISEGRIPHESLTVAGLALLYHYSVSLKHPMPPAILRNRVADALALYPSNSIIIGLFLEGERGQSVWGRIRKMLGESEGQAKDAARRVAEVWMAGWEGGRWHHELERTRSGLANAVDDERTRGSYVVWRIYLEFEIRSGDLTRAKKFFYRAIGECPLVKELYLLAFGPLRGAFNGRELKGIAETMVERGIRIWHDLDDILSGWELQEKEERAPESEEDEIMADAQEYRRLLPY